MDHSTHRHRRAAISKLFSRSHIFKIEGLVHSKAQRLCDKFLEYADRGPFDAATAYSCFTTDLITDYCFGRSTGFLEQPNWEPNYREPVLTMLSMTHLTRHIPVLTGILDLAPLYVSNSIRSWYSSNSPIEASCGASCQKLQI